ncbi:MAG: hypothetical protein HY905_04765 [Deltaproteobacteria bacterium]|nr:hypothetical protein [Deltaproteobacteria bacterium]
MRSFGVARPGLGFCTLLLGCPSLPPLVTPQPPVAEVEADPLLLLAERTAGGVEIEEIDAGELLERAAALADAGEWLDAVTIYDEVAARFAGTPAEKEALYRKGVCLEWAEDWTGALLSFRACLALAPGPDPDGEALPALIHAGLLAERLELWNDAAAAYEGLLACDALSDGDRRAATVRLAVVTLERGEPDVAQPMFEQVIEQSVAASTAGGPVHPAPAAEAELRLGMLEAERFSEVHLDSPDPAELRRQVEKLAAIFGDAFERLRAAILGGSAFWAVEAGYRVGALYVQIYDMFFDAPVPTALTEEQREAYEALLRARTRILLANALEAWEQNLVRAERAGVRGEAVDLTAEGMARVQGILEGRAQRRTAIDEEAEQYVEAQGESDPLAPVLERLGLEIGGEGAPAP